VEFEVRRDLRSGWELKSSWRRKRVPQMKPGECIEVICIRRLMNAFTLAVFVSDLRDLKRRFR